ncbi:MFS transporter [Corynebacterium sp.]|uniref:MFS transporter n=1 Tax=Corynebacterium sp. TaxID=1720 RepID=UPI0026DA71C1|nr:MFS transporter [Corynebacterium sp.]MDO5031349.1 MFS transporter [Corynebacterium sp.]
MLKKEWLRVALGMFLVAFGANLFAPMVVTYQLHTPLTVLHTTFLFGIYAVGIMVALFLGGPLSDSLGRRAIMRPAMLATITGSVVLLAGWRGFFLPLLLGRLLIGIAVGLSMSSGAAWIKELSTHIHAGARRSSIALSAGFALSPAVSGILAQFVLAPTLVPYLAHILLALGIIPLVWTAKAGPAAGRPGSFFPRSLLTPHFLPVAVAAPWVFGSATTAFAFLPSFLSEHLERPILAAGLTAMLTMGTGVGVQQLAGRVRVTTTHAMVFATAGMGLCLFIVANHEHPWTVWLLPLAAVVMGASYGMGMLDGLARTQALCDPAEVGAATGVFYSLTYLGFFAPFILSFLGPAVGYSSTFIVGILVAGLTALWLFTAGRGNRR